jgi:chorismate mutase
VKADAGLPVIDAEREAAVTATYSALAARHGVDDVIVAHLARVVISMARSVQAPADASVSARQVA